MRASEIAGMDFESFKEVLTDRGISIRTATPTEKEMEEEVKYRSCSVGRMSMESIWLRHRMQHRRIQRARRTLRAYLPVVS